MFFLEIVDDGGHPTCSYHGGDPGFVTVVEDPSCRARPRSPSRASELTLRTRTGKRVSLAVGLLGCALWLPPCADPPTASQLSPDGSLRVDLIETSSFIDRNFTIELTDVATGRSETVFESPDEGRPIGTERFVWSTDGSRFVLLGRNFFVTEEGMLEGPEQAYLMMDVPSNRIWTNARGVSSYPRFGVTDLRSIEWRGWTPE